MLAASSNMANPPPAVQQQDPNDETTSSSSPSSCDEALQKMALSDQVAARPEPTRGVKKTSSLRRGAAVYAELLQSAVRASIETRAEEASSKEHVVVLPPSPPPSNGFSPSAARDRNKRPSRSLQMGSPSIKRKSESEASRSEQDEEDFPLSAAEKQNRIQPSPRIPSSSDD